MVVGDGLFRRFIKENRPLSLFLENEYGREAVRLLQDLKPEQLDNEDSVLIPWIVDQVRIEGPRIVGTERAANRGGEWRPGEQPGEKVRTTRHYIVYQIVGEPSILEYWPDENEDGLPAIDADVDLMAAESSGPGAVYDRREAIRRHEAQLDQRRWFLGYRADEKTLALFTFADLTLDEYDYVARNEMNLRETFDAKLTIVQPIIDALAAQTRRYFDDVLPAILVRPLDDLRRFHRGRAAVMANLEWPEGWRQPRMEVVRAPRGAVDSPALGDMESEQELSVTHRARLSPASFEDVLRTMRVWVDAVERYPDAYTFLIEDRLSDLLCATLNAALPGANREVYSRAGKADILVRANVIDEGAGPAPIFICESKWWSGEENARKALDQLFGYLESKDTAAVLILFIKLKRPSAVRESAKVALAKRADYVETDTEIVSGWPMLNFKVDDRLVRVCIAFVDLPRRTAKPHARKYTR